MARRREPARKVVEVVIPANLSRAVVEDWVRPDLKDIGARLDSTIYSGPPTLADWMQSAQITAFSRYWRARIDFEREHNVKCPHAGWPKFEDPTAFYEALREVVFDGAAT